MGVLWKIFVWIRFDLFSILHLQGLPLYDLQNAKFSPSLKYGIASLFVIIISNYFDGKIKNLPKGLIRIGRNAIWYYFGQGIGSSLNYYIVNIIKMDNWIIKWLITFLVNVIITVVIAELLAFLYKSIQKMILLIKNKYLLESSL